MIRPTLPNLAEADTRSKALRDDVVDPLRKTVVLAGATAVAPDSWEATTNVRDSDAAEAAQMGNLTAGLRGLAKGLGVTGSALGGFMGVAQMVKGVHDNKPTLMLAGAAELTVSAAAVASFGVLPGAGALAPVGAGLLGLRALHDVRESRRIDRIDGWRDLITASSISASTLHAPLGVVTFLSSASVGFNALRGLYRIKQGHEQHNDFRLAQGTGALLSAAGVGLLPVATGPAVALLVGGVAMPILSQVSWTQNAVNHVSSCADQILYPLARKSDKIEAHLRDLARPTLDPISRAGERVWTSAPLKPVRQLGHEVGQRVAQSMDKLADTRAAHKFDEIFGKVTSIAPNENDPPDA